MGKHRIKNKNTSDKIFRSVYMNEHQAHTCINTADICIPSAYIGYKASLLGCKGAAIGIKKVGAKISISNRLF